ncbi:MAG TPA: hypothetical protein PLO41_17425 [Rubrivivax sp.]|nr:hypothetical protein [Rubrivivax sp.]
MEQPARFQPAVNQRSARAIGVTLPQGLLLRADMVIGGPCAAALAARTSPQRVAPAQALEAAEIPVGGDPFAAGFDGHRRQIGVGDEVALGAGIGAQRLEGRDPRPRAARCP